MLHAVVGLSLVSAQPIAPQQTQLRMGPSELPAFLAAMAESDFMDQCFQPPSRDIPGGMVGAFKGDPVPTKSETIAIAVRIYVIRRSDGTGGINEDLLHYMIRDANYGWRDHPIVFYQSGPVRHIDNDDYYTDLETLDEMNEVLDSVYEDGYLTWIVTPVLASGAVAGAWRGPPFTAGSRGIIYTYGATGTPANTATPPHEVGHVFNLDHPYETVWGIQCTSNDQCRSRGDRVCDTPASPIVSGLNTTALGYYFGNDPPPCDGDPPYDPNTRLYMEAGWPAGHILKDRFSPGQIERVMSKLTRFDDDLLAPFASRPFSDCDANGLDDLGEILSGTGVDNNRDMVLDNCQVFPNSGDLLVSGMTQDAFNRPRFYDGATGEYRGDIWNGLTWAHNLRMGPDGYVYMPRLHEVARLDLATGRSHEYFCDGKADGMSVLVDLAFDDDGNVIVLDNASAIMLKYDAKTGDLIGQFANLNQINTTSPKYMERGPDGHLYIASNGNRGNTIQKIDIQTGQSLGTFVSAGAGGLIAGQGLVFHEGVLYVSDGGANAVRMYDAFNGDPLGDLVRPGSGGLQNPHSLRFGPDGNLYIASRNTNSVKFYDGSNGDYLGNFVAPGPSSGGGEGFGQLSLPAGLLFIP